jgi:hypothetical protein
MKAKYTFQIKGKVRLANSIPITNEGFTFFFPTDDNGMVTHLEVECNCPPDEWPRVVNHPSGDSAIDVRSISWHFLFVKLQGIEALCSVWGLKAIDKKNYKIEWIPENEEEKSKLIIRNFKVLPPQLQDNEIRPLSFPYIGQAIIASWDGSKLSTLCSFYRRGVEDYENDLYITAIYQFYFILESLYGDGKFKENDLIKKFDASDELKKIFYETFKDNQFLNGLKMKYVDKINRSEHYGDRDFSKFMLRFIRLRGFLHHHSSKNRKVWHPDNHDEFKIDAFLLSVLTNRIVFDKIWSYCGSENVVELYNKQIKELGY